MINYIKYNKDRNKVIALDLESKSIKVVENELNKYNNDNIDINNTIGTILFKLNNKSACIISLSNKGDKFIVLFNLLDNLEVDKYSNYNAEVPNYNEFNADWFNKKYWKFAGNVSIFCGSGVKGRISKSEFLEKTFGICNDTQVDDNIQEKQDDDQEVVADTNGKVENNTDKKVENNAISVPNNTNEFENVIKNYISEISKREANLLNKEKQLNELESELIKKRTKLVNLLHNVDDSFIEDNSEELVSVVDIADDFSDRDKYKPESSQKILYDTILKTLKENDSISVPIEYYKELKVLAHKIFNANQSYNKYNAFISVKLDQKSDYSVSFMIDYDENNPYIRMQVIKEYNIRTLTSKDVILLETKYLDWKKQHSFTV